MGSDDTILVLYRRRDIQRGYDGRAPCTSRTKQRLYAAKSDKDGGESGHSTIRQQHRAFTEE